MNRSYAADEPASSVLCYGFAKHSDACRTQNKAYINTQHKIVHREDAASALVLSANVLSSSVICSQLAMFRWSVREARTTSEATTILMEQVAQAYRQGYEVRREEAAPMGYNKYARDGGMEVVFQDEMRAIEQRRRTRAEQLEEEMQRKRDAVASAAAAAMSASASATNASDTAADADADAQTFARADQVTSLPHESSHNPASCNATVPQTTNTAAEADVLSSGGPPSENDDDVFREARARARYTPASILTRVVVVDVYTHNTFSEMIHSIREIDAEYGLQLIVVLLNPTRRGDGVRRCSEEDAMCQTHDRAEQHAESAHGAVRSFMQSNTSQQTDNNNSSSNDNSNNSETWVREMQGAGVVLGAPHSIDLQTAYALGYDLVITRPFDHIVVDFLTSLVVSAAGRWRNDVRARAAVGNYMGVKHLLRAGGAFMSATTNTAKASPTSSSSSCSTESEGEEVVSRRDRHASHDPRAHHIRGRSRRRRRERTSRVLSDANRTQPTDKEAQGKKTAKQHTKHAAASAYNNSGSEEEDGDEEECTESVGAESCVDSPTSPTAATTHAKRGDDGQQQQQQQQHDEHASSHRAHTRSTHADSGDHSHESHVVSWTAMHRPLGSGEAALNTISPTRDLLQYTMHPTERIRRLRRGANSTNNNNNNNNNNNANGNDEDDARSINNNNDSNNNRKNESAGPMRRRARGTASAPASRRTRHPPTVFAHDDLFDNADETQTALVRAFESEMTRLLCDQATLREELNLTQRQLTRLAQGRSRFNSASAPLSSHNASSSAPAQVVAQNTQYAWGTHRNARTGSWLSPHRTSRDIAAGVSCSLSSYLADEAAGGNNSNSNSNSNNNRVNAAVITTTTAMDKASVLLGLSKEQQIYLLKERLETANERIRDLIRVSRRRGGGRLFVGSQVNNNNNDAGSSAWLARGRLRRTTGDAGANGLVLTQPLEAVEAVAMHLCDTDAAEVSSSSAAAADLRVGARAEDGSMFHSTAKVQPTHKLPSSAAGKKKETTVYQTATAEPTEPALRAVRKVKTKGKTTNDKMDIHPHVPTKGGEFSTAGASATAQSRTSHGMPAPEEQPSGRDVQEGKKEGSRTDETDSSQANLRTTLQSDSLSRRSSEPMMMSFLDSPRMGRLGDGLSRKVDAVLRDVRAVMAEVSATSSWRATSSQTSSQNTPRIASSEEMTPVTAARTTTTNTTRPEMRAKTTKTRTVEYGIQHTIETAHAEVARPQHSHGTADEQCAKEVERAQAAPSASPAAQFSESTQSTDLHAAAAQSANEPSLLLPPAGHEHAHSERIEQSWQPIQSESPDLMHRLYNQLGQAAACIVALRQRLEKETRMRIAAQEAEKKVSQMPSKQKQKQKQQEQQQQQQKQKQKQKQEQNQKQTVSSAGATLSAPRRSRRGVVSASRQEGGGGGGRPRSVPHTAQGRRSTAPEPEEMCETNTRADASATNGNDTQACAAASLSSIFSAFASASPVALKDVKATAKSNTAAALLRALDRTGSHASSKSGRSRSNKTHKAHADETDSSGNADEDDSDEEDDEDSPRRVWGAKLQRQAAAMQREQKWQLTHRHHQAMAAVVAYYRAQLRRLQQRGVMACSATPNEKGIAQGSLTDARVFAATTLNDTCAHGTDSSSCRPCHENDSNETMRNKKETAHGVINPSSNHAEDAQYDARREMPPFSRQNVWSWVDLDVAAVSRQFGFAASTSLHRAHLRTDADEDVEGDSRAREMHTMTFSSTQSSAPEAVSDVAHNTSSREYDMPAEECDHDENEEVNDSDAVDLALDAYEEDIMEEEDDTYDTFGTLEANYRARKQDKDEYHNRSHSTTTTTTTTVYNRDNINPSVSSSTSKRHATLFRAHRAARVLYHRLAADATRGLIDADRMLDVHTALTAPVMSSRALLDRCLVMHRELSLLLRLLSFAEPTLQRWWARYDSAPARRALGRWLYARETTTTTTTTTTRAAGVQGGGESEETMRWATTAARMRRVHVLLALDTAWLTWAVDSIASVQLDALTESSASGVQTKRVQDEHNDDDDDDDNDNNNTEVGEYESKDDVKLCEGGQEAGRTIHHILHDRIYRYHGTAPIKYLMHTCSSSCDELARVSDGDSDEEGWSDVGTDDDDEDKDRADHDEGQDSRDEGFNSSSSSNSSNPPSASEGDEAGAAKSSKRQVNHNNNNNHNHQHATLFLFGDKEDLSRRGDRRRSRYGIANRRAIRAIIRELRAAACERQSRRAELALRRTVEQQRRRRRRLDALLAGVGENDEDDEDDYDMDDDRRNRARAGRWMLPRGCAAWYGMEAARRVRAILRHRHRATDQVVVRGALVGKELSRRTAGGYARGPDDGDGDAEEEETNKKKTNSAPMGAGVASLPMSSLHSSSAWPQRAVRTRALSSMRHTRKGDDVMLRRIGQRPVRLPPLLSSASGGGNANDLVTHSHRSNNNNNNNKKSHSLSWLYAKGGGYLAPRDEASLRAFAKVASALLRSRYLSSDGFGHNSSSGSSSAHAIGHRCHSGNVKNSNNNNNNNGNSNDDEERDPLRYYRDAHVVYDRERVTTREEAASRGEVVTEDDIAAAEALLNRMLRHRNPCSDRGGVVLACDNPSSAARCDADALALSAQGEPHRLPLPDQRTGNTSHVDDDDDSATRHAEHEQGQQQKQLSRREPNAPNTHHTREGTDTTATATITTLTTLSYGLPIDRVGDLLAATAQTLPTTRYTRTQSAKASRAPRVPDTRNYNQPPPHQKSSQGILHTGVDSANGAHGLMSNESRVHVHAQPYATSNTMLFVPPQPTDARLCEGSETARSHMVSRDGRSPHRGGVGRQEMTDTQEEMRMASPAALAAARLTALLNYSMHDARVVGVSSTLHPLSHATRRRGAKRGKDGAS